MTWQEACAKSKTKRAVRYGNSGYKIIRTVEDAMVYINPHRVRFAFKQEIEGFNDWEPEGKEE